MESFIGRLRDECLNETIFASLPQARTVLDAWRADYNGVRPHSALDCARPDTRPINIFRAGQYVPRKAAKTPLTVREIVLRLLPARGLQPSTKAIPLLFLGQKHLKPFI